MINITALRLSIVFGVIAALSGCALPWPNLPPEEYTGTVINGPLNRAEAGAKVFARRYPSRGIDIAAPTDLIGSTTTRADGSFHLRTRSGYAFELAANSADGRLGAIVRVRSERHNIHLRLEPRVYGSETANAAEAAIRPGAKRATRRDL